MQMSQVDEITDAVLLASRALVGVAVRSLAAIDGDVTLPQFRALVVLCSRGPLGMGDLAESLGASPSTATRLCDRLVEHGLVERAPRPENRREVEVAATRAGAAVVAKVTKRRRAEIGRIVEDVPARHRPAMVDALRAFADAAGEVPDQAWAFGWDATSGAAS